jgi:YegS/Rv2252/BmrU family lipid kinase
VIVNPHAGNGKAVRLVPKVTSLLAALPCEHQVEQTTSLGHARDLAREAAARGEVAVAMGGDGLVAAVAGALRGSSEGCLGIIPAGRGNDFARKLGIPHETAGACQTLVTGVPLATDVAEVNGVPFLGATTAGISSDTQVIADETRLPLGRFVYAYAVLRALASWKPADFRVVADGAELPVHGFSVSVANSGVFGGGMLLSPDSKLDDGLLEVVIFDDEPRYRFAAQLPLIFKGTHVNVPECRILQAPTIPSDSARPFTVYADGDAVTELPATIRVAPAAVRVIAPPA